MKMIVEGFLFTESNAPGAIYEILEKKAQNYLHKKFGLDISSKVEVGIFSEGSILESKVYQLNVLFTEYLENNGYYNEIKSIILRFEDKGLYPFQDNGEYYVRNAFSCTAVLDTEKCQEEIYGIRFCDLFQDYVKHFLSCSKTRRCEGCPPNNNI